jgi:hypothetical protein
MMRKACFRWATLTRRAPSLHVNTVIARKACFIRAMPAPQAPGSRTSAVKATPKWHFCVWRAACHADTQVRLRGWFFIRHGWRRQTSPDKGAFLRVCVLFASRGKERNEKVRP